MAKALEIHHVTLVVDDLDKARAFYENELGLEPIPVFNLDFPAQFFRVNDTQQLHVTEWEDSYSFRGHVCFRVDNFNEIFRRMKARGAIDTAPWGKVRRLPDGAMQMFIRDPSGNLVEISAAPGSEIDPALFEESDLVQGDGVYVSGREDARGLRGEGATLYHGSN